MQSIEQMIDSLREQMDGLGRVTMPLSMVESFLKLAYSSGKVDALIEYRNELAKDTPK